MRCINQLITGGHIAPFVDEQFHGLTINNLGNKVLC